MKGDKKIHRRKISKKMLKDIYGEFYYELFENDNTRKSQKKIKGSNEK
ncbi:MAG: hypothetical protein LBP26_06275 [Clostridiales bacterium]|jgi:hypothetical protein|nr:hypothetical protein [Clostridiales bacterium]